MVSFKSWRTGEADETKNSEQYGAITVAERQPSPGSEPKDFSSNEHVDSEDDTALHRGLKARHVTMIAIGGALGTGLLIGTGNALYQAGPGSIFIAYSIVGVIAYLVMCALGEMATWLPMSSGFTGYATRFCDPALGFALGYTYWFKYIIITPNQLVASALVIQYWVSPERVNPGVFIAILMVIIILINAVGSVKFFGEFEFWLSSMKVIIICGIILLCLIIALGGGPTHDRLGFRYWQNPGAFKPYLETGDLGKFLGFWSSFVNAVFAFLGTELVGVTVGEAANPSKVIPRAIRLTFYRIVFFYILSILFLGMCVPYDASLLQKANNTKVTTAAASPFVVAVRLAQIDKLPHILNACLLVFTFSASNSDLYIASRTLYGLAKEGKAPRFFAKTGRNGIPYPALALSSCFCCLAFMATTTGGNTVFKYFVNMVSMFGLLTWISILVSHVYFVRARKAQGIPDSSLVYTAPLGLWGTYIALGFCCLIGITKNFNVFVHGFDYKNFITGYLGIPLYLIMILGYKLVMRSKEIKPEEADLFTGRDKIAREEQEYIARQEAMKGSGMSANRSKAYRLISWLL